MAPLSGAEAVASYLGTLREDAEQKLLSDAARSEVLGQLKVLGRDANNIKDAYDADAVELLARYGFGQYSEDVRREALRCLANALILVPTTQDTFAASGLLSKAAILYGSQDDDDEFLGARMLFLMTYNRSSNLPRLLTDHDLPAKVTEHLRRHIKIGEPLVGAGITSMALSETLKLLFNLAHFVPQQVASFSSATPILVELLKDAKIPSPPLQPPISYLLNALASLQTEPVGGDLQAGQSEMPDADMLSWIDKLTHILDKSLSAYTYAQLDTQIISLLTMIRRINATSSPAVQAKLRDSLLPRDAERDLPLGKSSTLASRLLKLTTAPGVTHLSEVVSSLLFELSGSDAHTFVKNVGYGYAAGYLMTHKIPIPESAKQTTSVNDSVPINPVTGQRLDREATEPLPEMTDAEKEREAERLFVLFERLKATGVVDVINPVEQAREEGQLKEVSDSD